MKQYALPEIFVVEVSTEVLHVSGYDVIGKDLDWDTALPGGDEL